MAPGPQRWLRHYRQYHDMTIDDLAKASGLSKVFVGKIERGDRRPSPQSKQALADALGERVNDVFPTDGRMSPEEAAEYYVEGIRSRKHGGVSEDEFDADMRAHGLDPEEEAAGTDAVWFSDDGETLIIDGRRFYEEMTAIHIQVQPLRVKHKIPRPREHKASRSRRSSKSSSSDDPGEPHLDDFVGTDPPAEELERAGTVPGQHAVSGAARPQGVS